MRPYATLVDGGGVRIDKTTRDLGESEPLGTGKIYIGILPVGLRQLLNGSNARWTPKQHLSDLVADTNEPGPEIHVPDTIMTDHTFATIQV